MALESKIESDTRLAIKKLGGLFIKLNPLHYAGIPDRLILGKYKTIIFVEKKRPGKDPTKIQRHWHKTLRKLGFRVLVSCSVEETREAFIEELLIMKRLHYATKDL